MASAEQHQQSSSNGRSYLFLAAAFVIVIAGLKAAANIVQPLLLSAFIAVIATPVYDWLLKKKLPAWLALLSVVTGVVVTFVVFLMFVLSSVADFSARQDHYVDQLRIRLKPVTQMLDNILPDEVSDPPEKVRDDESGTTVDDAQDESSVEADSGKEVGGTESNRESADVDSALADSETTPAVENSSPEKGVNPDWSDPGIPGNAEAANSADSGNTSGAMAAEAPASEQASSAEDNNDDEITGDSDEADSSLDDKEQSDSESSILRMPWDGSATPPAPPQSRRDWRKLIRNQFDPGMIIPLAASIATSMSQLLSDALLILLTVVFILLEASSFPAKLRAAFTDANRETTQRYAEVIHSVRSYIAIKAGVSLLTGGLVWSWLWIFGVPYAALWGLLAFLLNFIPNIGSFIAAIPALLVAWLDLGLLPMVGCLAGYVVVNTGIGNFLEPRILGRGLGLSTLVIFCSMVFWGWVLGPVGMLLSVPLTMAARIACEGFDDTRWIAILMGNSEPRPAE